MVSEAKSCIFEKSRWWVPRREITLRRNKKNPCKWGNHFYYTLTINEPWDCRQQIIQPHSKYKAAFTTVQLSHLLTHQPFNEHVYSAVTPILGSIFLQTLHSKAQLTLANWGVTKLLNVLSGFAYPTPLQAPTFYLSGFSGSSTSTPKCLHIKLSLQSQHMDVWVYCTDAWRAGEPGLFSFWRAH